MPNAPKYVWRGRAPPGPARGSYAVPQTSLAAIGGVQGGREVEGATAKGDGME